MWRKKATPAPAFKQPVPFLPVTGQHAPLGVPGIHTRLAYFQVVEADTHDDYVICRGWDLDRDPECRYRFDKIPIAKPYGLRGTNPYSVGQMLLCAKARTSLGDNPGVAAVTTGHPASLSELIELLKDEQDHPINWVIAESGGGISSYGAAYGAGSTVGHGDTKVVLGTLATDTTDDITLADNGLLFANAGAYMASGTVAVAAAYSGDSYLDHMTASIYRKRGSDLVKIVEMDSHWQASGSGDRGFQGVITDYPIAIEAGDYLYLYASAGNDYDVAVCISAILGVHTVGGGSGGDSSGVLTDGDKIVGGGA